MQPRLPFDTFVLLALSVALVAVLVRGEPEQAVAPSSRDARFVVEFSDTFQGLSALYAVRACSGDRRSAAGESARAVIAHEVLAPSVDEIVVRLIDRPGKEISKHEGAADVCGCARAASAFIRESDRALNDTASWVCS